MTTPTLTIGWAQADLTPSQPVIITGQFHARVSEGVADPITATALALASPPSPTAPADHAVLVSCDLVSIPDELRAAVRARLANRAPGLDPAKVVLNATHTHTGPEIRIRTGTGTNDTGAELPVLKPADYQPFAADRIADAVVRAWTARQPGGVSFGLGAAVVGRNRRAVYTTGQAQMYGKTDRPDFSHIEGYEDHSVGFLATYDPAGKLTGLLVNVPCPSQVSEHDYQLSADYWCEARAELRCRFGEALFILPQCSAAGDQSPHLLFDRAAATRMLQLKNRTVRQEIAHRIADAASDTVPFLASAINYSPALAHRAETLDLPMLPLTPDDANTALKSAEECRVNYEAELKKLQSDPALRNQPRWYVPVTTAHHRDRWFRDVAARYERQSAQPNRPTELHVLRLGDAAFVSVPFEYYLDHGIFIKARSHAAQTFLVQLAGAGTYCPSARSLVGGGYGSLPASNPIGPAGGRQLAERAVDILADLFPQ